MTTMAEETDLMNVEIENEPQAQKSASRGIKPWMIIVFAVLLLAVTATIVYFLMRADAGTTSKIRDIFIIFMALEFVIIGVALVILIIQLAKLVNLLENEVKPIIAATSETINTLKGTTDFLSNSLVVPVIKLNSYMAGFKKVFDLLKIVRK